MNISKLPNLGSEVKRLFQSHPDGQMVVECSVTSESTLWIKDHMTCQCALSRAAKRKCQVLFLISNHSDSVEINECNFKCKWFKDKHIYLWRRQRHPNQYSCLENPMDGGAGGLRSMGSRGVGHDWETSLSLSLSCIGEGNGNPLQCSCLFLGQLKNCKLLSTILQFSLQLVGTELFYQI